MSRKKTNRRSFLGSVTATLSLLLAGCSEISDVLNDGPDPQVTDVASGQSVTDTITGSVEIRALVENQGESGDVQVTITTYDSAGNILDTFEQTVPIDQGQSRRVDFNVSPSDGAERFEAEAEAA